jgi:hypothetical protein
MTKGLYDKTSSNPLDLRSSNEATVKSLQASTQHSLNFKHSFSSRPAGKDLPDPEVHSFSGNSSLKSTLRSDLRYLKDLDEEERRMNRRKSSKSLEESALERFKENKLIGIKNVRSSFPELEVDLAHEGEEEEGKDLMIPQLKWCAFCKKEVMTQVEFVSNSKTFWSAVGIFLSGGFLGCFLLPYMSNNCKGVRILCHNCGRVLT